LSLFHRLAVSLLIALTLTFLTIFYLKKRQSQILNSPRKVLLLFSLACITLLSSKGIELYFFSLFKVSYPLIVPLIALFLSSLFHFEIAVFASIFLSIFLGFSLNVDAKTFILLNCLVSLIIAIGSEKIYRRRALFFLCGKAYLTILPLMLAFSVSKMGNQPDIIYDLIPPLVFLFGTAFLGAAFLPFLEKYFNISTHMTVMEYLDFDSELLRRMSVEAPGTYQHSLIVSYLSETAARAIKANDLFCRVCALYHDIGKLSHPHYFTENQLENVDMHPLFTPSESAQMIISHVIEGESLAKKMALPDSFIDIIREHHGTSLVTYFFSKEVEQKGKEKAIENLATFRYPGPKPKTRESAIIMFADSVEAASRSWESFSQEKIYQLVDQLIQEKVLDGQLDQCQLTFEELERIKEAFVKGIIVSYHMRVKYPPLPSLLSNKPLKGYT
jgi:cyclic-di-AMP phosphodiesterase PgpH